MNTITVRLGGCACVSLWIASCLTLNGADTILTALCWIFGGAFAIQTIISYIKTKENK